jgi:hypothetical protein
METDYELTHNELEKFFDTYSNAEKAKSFRSMGAKQISAAILKERGGVPCILAADFIYGKDPRLTIEEFYNYFLICLISNV